MQRKDFSAALAALGGAGGLLRSSEPLSLSPGASLAAPWLEEAADLLVMHRDFPAALEKCEKGCQNLPGEPEDGDSSSSEEVKCGLCVVGIQALAEMDRWRDVLPWILQYYQDPGCWPPKILELCPAWVIPEEGLVSCSIILALNEISLEEKGKGDLKGIGLVLPDIRQKTWVELLYLIQDILTKPDLDHILLHSKVEEPQVMLEIGNDWLRSSTNQLLPTYGLLVQLYVFHVLLPLGHFAEAEGLVQDCKALSEEQQVEVHESIEEKKHQWLQQEEECQISEDLPDLAWKQQLGMVSQKMLTVLAQLGRALGSLAGQLCSIPYKKTLLAAFMLCLIVVRLDPASPTALPFIYRLLQLFHQARSAVFSSHYRPPIQD